MLKQMRLIYAKGFSINERKQWKVTIFQNMLHAFQVVFGAMEEQEVDFAEGSNIVSPDMLVKGMLDADDDNSDSRR